MEEINEGKMEWLARGMKGQIRSTKRGRVKKKLKEGMKEENRKR